jgi:hypothetical protein
VIRLSPILTTSLNESQSYTIHNIWQGRRSLNWIASQLAVATRSCLSREHDLECKLPIGYTGMGRPASILVLWSKIWSRSVKVSSGLLWKARLADIPSLADSPNSTDLMVMLTSLKSSKDQWVSLIGPSVTLSSMKRHANRF